jgi:hypothetical protein
MLGHPPNDTKFNSFHLKRQLPSSPRPVPDISNDPAIPDPAAGWDLRIISTPPNVPLQSVTGYAYRDERNPMFVEQPRVYVHDTGYTTDGPTYQQFEPNQIEWMHIPADALPASLGTFQSPPREDDISTDFHGSCMASKAVGTKFGVSKKASLTIVRRPGRILDEQDRKRGYDVTTSPLPQAVLGLELILEDIRKRKNGPSSVINYSQGATPRNGFITIGDAWSTHPADNPANYFHPLWSILNDLVEEGATIVVSTGNYATMDPSNPFHGPISYQLSSIPGIFNDRLPIIAVGSSQFDSTLAPIQP